MKSLVEKGLISRKLLKWELSKSIKEIEIPSNLKEIIKKSIENLKLSNNEKKTLQYFTLLNKPITIEEFKKILPSEIDINLKDFFIDLENIELLISEKQQNIETKKSLSLSYSFTHSLIHEVIEEEIIEKQEFHHHIAQRIEDIYKDKLDEYIDELANHYSQTDDMEKAIHYLEKAGDKAKENYENEKAICYYDKLISLMILLINKRRHI
ncbi:MAG: hypothetical protein K8S23_15310 [Candidatus Cloacimonetes bacterium]|nr:hypothetical protein [Candidatus Cloacimonadota bacterium]